jgi:hypothetical protein
LNPTSRLRRRATLSISSAAPMSRTIERAIWPTASRLRALSPATTFRGGALAAASPLDLSTAMRSGRDAASEGATPNCTPVKAESPAAKASTTQSRWMSPARGNAKAVIWGMARRLQEASGVPMTPPAEDISRLSIRS